MNERPKILLVSTYNDQSLNLFYLPDSTIFIEPYFLYYNASTPEIQAIFQHNYQYIYFRDPFNDKNIDQVTARNVTETVMSRYPDAYMVDHVSSYNDLLFEDKWEQYKIFPDIMPRTSLLNVPSEIDFNSTFVKKRLSSRARDIIFTEDDFPDNFHATDYIVQPKIDIEIEYRACWLGTDMIKPLAIKSSKKIDQKVKVIGTEKNIDPRIIEIGNIVYERTKYDLVGIDIARTKTGFVVIEVNRSCQFSAFLRESNTNIAVLLAKKLLSSNQKI